MKKPILLIFLLSVCLNLLAQDVISYSQFVDLLHKGGDIEFYEVGAPPANYIDEYLFGQNNDIHYVEEILIRHCFFERLIISDLIVQSNLKIIDCHFRNIDVFNGSGGSYNGDILLLNTTVKNQLNIIDNTKIETDLSYEIYESTIGDLSIWSTRFKTPCYLYIDYSYIFNGLSLVNDEINAITFDSVKFKGPLNISRSGKIGKFFIDECEFYDPVNFSNLNVAKEFSIQNTTFFSGVDLYNAKFDIDYTEIDWSSISNSLITSQVKDETERYYKIQNIYLRLINYYREKNLPIESKESFVEYKNIEREHYRRMISSEGFFSSFRNSVTYFFLSSLKWLSNYSTDFILTIWRTVIIILIFGVFYFFYNSFYYNRRIISIFLRQNSKRKKNHSKTSVAIKFFYMYLNRLFFRCDYQSRRKLLIEASQLTSRQFIWKYLLRESIVSFFASLNFFVTLGFAGVTLKGKLKYFAIIEGMIGWLILVILSAALVNSFIMI